MSDPSSNSQHRGGECGHRIGGSRSGLEGVMRMVFGDGISPPAPAG